MRYGNKRFNLSTGSSSQPGFSGNETTFIIKQVQQSPGYDKVKDIHCKITLFVDGPDKGKVATVTIVTADGKPITGGNVTGTISDSKDKAIITIIETKSQGTTPPTTPTTPTTPTAPNVPTVRLKVVTLNSDGSSPISGSQYSLSIPGIGNVNDNFTTPDSRDDKFNGYGDYVFTQLGVPEADRIKITINVPKDEKR